VVENELNQRRRGRWSVLGICRSLRGRVLAVGRVGGTALRVRALHVDAGHLIVVNREEMAAKIVEGFAKRYIIWPCTKR